jgi:hypothetical protein
MTNKSGSADAGPGAGTGTTYGPYLQQAPQNPFVPAAVNTVVNNVAVTPAPTTAANSETSGWYYQQTTGKIAAAGFNEATGQMR